jgi:hypothetical protein
MGLHSVPQRVYLGLTLYLCMLCIGTRLLRFTLASLTDDLVVGFVQLLTWITVLVGIGVTCGLLMHPHAPPRRRYVLPLLLLLATMLSASVISYTSISIDIDMLIKQRAREAVVPHILEQFARAPHADRTADRLVTLPGAQAVLSAGGGQVVVRQHAAHTLVMFYVWRGSLDSSSGFVIYTTNTAVPHTPMLRGVRRLKDQWFFGVEVWP